LKDKDKDFLVKEEIKKMNEYKIGHIEMTTEPFDIEMGMFDKYIVSKENDCYTLDIKPSRGGIVYHKEIAEELGRNTIIGGGQVTYYEPNVKFWGASSEYGGVDTVILQQFVEPLKQRLSLDGILGEMEFD
jgi:hypothetical protein